MIHSDAAWAVRGRPIKVRWAGWTSDTYTLQQAGWQLAAHQDPMRRMLGLAVNHQEFGAQGMSWIPEEWHHEASRFEDYHIERHMDLRIGKRVEIRHQGSLEPYRPIDAEPTWRGSERITSLEDLCHFAPAPLARTNPIVVPEESVDELLAKILDKQQEAKSAYFREKMRESYAEGTASRILPAHKFHAQIISLRDAA